MNSHSYSAMLWYLRNLFTVHVFMFSREKSSSTLSNSKRFIWFFFLHLHDYNLWKSLWHIQQQHITPWLKRAEISWKEIVKTNTTFQLKDFHLSHPPIFHSSFASSIFKSTANPAWQTINNPSALLKNLLSFSFSHAANLFSAINHSTELFRFAYCEMKV